MSPKLETFLDRHITSLVVGVCTVIGWIFVLGVMYHSITARLDQCEAKILASRDDRAGLRELMTRHIDSQIAAEKDTSVRLARIEAGVEWLKESAQNKRADAGSSPSLANSNP